jgi:hypothetical protein
MAENTYTKLPARTETHKRFNAFAGRWRMSMTEATDLAIETLESLTREELAARIERRPPAPRRGRPRREPVTA